MEDAITIMANLATGNFEKGAKEIKSAIKSLTRTAKSFASTMTSQIVGVTSIIGILSKSISSYMNQNEQLSNKISSIWTALGNILGPIIEQIVDWVSTAISYFIKFLNLLGVTSKSASELSKSAKKSTTELQKTLLGFDELNVLSDNSSSSSDSSGSSGLDDVDATSWMEDLVNMIKNGDWAGIAEWASDALISGLNKISEAIESVDWQKIGTAIRDFFLNIKYEEIADAIFNLLKTAWDAALDLLWGILAGDSEEEPPLVSSLRSLGNAVEELYGKIKEVVKIVWKDYIKPFVDWLIEQGLPAFIDTITALVKKLTNFITNHSDTAAQIIVGIIDVIIAYKISSRITKIISSVSKLWTTLSANPIAFIITLIALLIVKFIAAYQTNEEFREKVDIAMAGIKEGITNIVNFIKNLIEKIKEFFSGAKEAITGFVESFKEKIEGFKEKVENVKEKFTEVKDKVSDVCTSISDAWNNSDLTTGEKLGQISATVLGTFSEIHDHVVEKMDAIMDKIIPGWSETKEKVTGYITGIKETAVSEFSQMVSESKTHFNTMCTSIKETMNNSNLTVTEKAKAIGSIIKTEFSEMRETVKEKMLNIADSIIPGFKDIYEGVQEKVSNIKETISDAFHSVVDLATSWGSDLLSNFISGIMSWFNSLVDTVSSIANTIWSYLHFSEPEKGPLSDFSSYGPDMMKELAGGITKNKGLVEKAVNDIADTVDFKMPSVAGGTVVPYSVSASGGGGASSTTDVAGAIQALYGAITSLESSLTNMQWIAQFGNVRAVVQEITRQQKQIAKSEGR